MFQKIQNFSQDGGGAQIQNICRIIGKWDVKPTGILSKQNRTTMNVPASLVETIDVGTAVTSMIVRTAVLTKVVGTAVLTKVVGTANKELFVIAIIVGTVVSTIIVRIPVPPMIV